LLFSGSPAGAETQLSGKVWSRSMSKQELLDRAWQFPILSTKLVAGSPLVRIYSEQEPGYGFETVPPDLEDVFFSHLSKA